jgi:hypothetical protein
LRAVAQQEHGGCGARLSGFALRMYELKRSDHVEIIGCVSSCA